MDIPEDERDLVTETLVPATKMNLEYSLRALLGQVISDKVLNKKAIKNIMFKTWEDYKKLYITEMGNNKFLFTFPSVDNAEEVLRKAPWFVMNNLLSLQRWEEGKAFADIDFSKVCFWIQIHGLPWGEVNHENAPILLNRVGKVVEVDDPFKSGSGSSHFIRAKVAVDVNKPLWSGCWIQRPGNTRKWVHFKYERLQGICFKCGSFGHDQKFCEIPSIMAADNKTLPKYGPFLYASKPKVFHGSYLNQQGRQTQNQAGTSSHPPSPNEDSDPANGQKEKHHQHNYESTSLPDFSDLADRGSPIPSQNREKGNSSNSINSQHKPDFQSKVPGIIRRLPSKDYALPKFDYPPPYFVEFPLEDKDIADTSSHSIPEKVEETLSAELQTRLKIKRIREPTSLYLTNGEVCEDADNLSKKARVVAVIDDYIYVETHNKTEEAGHSMPPTVK